ncbi:mucin-2-like [Biomphalaria glabrata]|uniref:Mucin-2-like n=1 Tax=Biomphalaria glabrata TaxID=6526 RepID=A0A9U8EH81_BIOGL|nr:mucin-2-like [Biomphalaria glabrata]
MTSSVHCLKKLTVLVSVISLISYSTQAQQIECQNVGVGDPNKFDIDNFEFSSQDPNNGIEQIRYNCCQESYGHAWCPQVNDQSPRLEIKLPQPISIGGLIIQRPSTTPTNPLADKFMKYFNLYFVTSSDAIVQSNKIAEGIANTSVHETTLTFYPLIVKHITIEPKEWEKQACFRLELLECYVITAQATPATPPPLTTTTTVTTTTTLITTTEKVTLPPVPNANWSLIDFTQDFVISNGFNLSLVGQPNTNSSGIHLETSSQFIQITDSSIKCLTNPTNCQAGFTISLVIKITTLVEGSILFTSGGDKPDQPGITFIYRFGQIHVVVSTSTLSWYISLSHTQILSWYNKFTTIYVSWSVQQNLQLIVDEVLVAEALFPLSHSVTSAITNSLIIGGNTVQCIVSSIKIWLVHIFILINQSIVSCQCNFGSTTTRTSTTRPPTTTPLITSTSRLPTTVLFPTSTPGTDCNFGCIPQDSCSTWPEYTEPIITEEIDTTPTQGPPISTISSSTSRTSTATTQAPTTAAPQPTTQAPTTAAPQHTTQKPTTAAPQPTTQGPTTAAPQPTTTTTAAPQPTTQAPTTAAPQPTTQAPTTAAPQSTTQEPTTAAPKPTTTAPTTAAPQPTTTAPTTAAPQPTTTAPTTAAPQPTTTAPTTAAPQPITTAPTTAAPQPTTTAPTTAAPQPTTASPTTAAPQSTTASPTTAAPQPTTTAPTTAVPEPTTTAPTTAAPQPTTTAPTTAAPQPTTASPTTAAPQSTTASPTTAAPQPTTTAPTTAAPQPTTTAPTTAAPQPTTAAPTTAAPTTAAPQPTTTAPTTAAPQPTTTAPTTAAPQPTTTAPTTAATQPTTTAPTTAAPQSTTTAPTTAAPQPTTTAPTTAAPQPTTTAPTTAAPQPTTTAPTTAAPQPTTTAPTTAAPQPTTASPTTAAPQPTTTVPTTTAAPRPTTTTTPPCPEFTYSVSLATTVNSNGQGLLSCSISTVPPVGVTVQFTWYINGVAVNVIKVIEAPDRSATILASETGVDLLNKVITCSAEVKFLTSGALWCHKQTSNTLRPTVTCPPSTPISVTEGGGHYLLHLNVSVPPALFCKPEDSSQCRVEVVTNVLGTNQELKCSQTQIIPQVVIGVDTVGDGSNKQCGVLITNNNWFLGVTIPIKATVDGISDGNRIRKLRIFVRIVGSVSNSVNDVYCNDIDITAINGPNPSSCSSVNDPHMTTFDKRRYNNMLQGEFVLYRHTTLPYEVSVLYRPCVNGNNRVTCNCGAAVRSGDDVITFKTCDARQNLPQYGGGNSIIIVEVFKNGEFTKGTKIRRYGTGQKYEVTLPIGTKITVLASRKPFMDINVVASALDHSKTEGLCGDFNGNALNDFNGMNEASFNSFWRRSGSLFNGVAASTYTSHEKFCSCINSQTALCDEGLDVFTCTTTQTNPADVTNSLVQQAKLPVLGQTQIRSRRYVRQTVDISGSESFTVEQATDYCTNYLENSSTVLNCVLQLDKRTVNASIASCVEDLVDTGEREWALPHVRDLTEQCLTIARQDPDVWNATGTNDGEPDLPETITTSLCPEPCGNNGDCINGVCICKAGYSGEKCDVTKDTVPIVLPATEACDLMGSSCTNVFIDGLHFYQSSNLTCHIRYVTVSDRVTLTGEVATVPATYISVSQITCPVLSRRNAFISVSNDKVRQSNHSYLHVYTKSSCQECDISTAGDSATCKWKPYTCIIDDQCYVRDELYVGDNCFVCNPDKRTDGWSALSAPQCQATVQPLEGSKSTTDDTAVIVLGVITGVLCLSVLIVAAYLIKKRIDRKKKHRYLSRDNSDTSSVDFSGARVAQTSSGHVISEDPKGDRLAAAYNPTFN